jgi:UDP-glucose 4-epimerase
MKTALVTGGCGFIGSNLVKELVKLGWQVDVVDNMSNGHLELLNNLNLRVLPNGSFFTAFKMQDDIKRKKDEVIVIQDDYTDQNVLSAIYQGSYDIIFHQAAMPRVGYSVDNPGQTTYENISKTVQLFESAAKSVKRIVWASSSSVYGGAQNLPTQEDESKNPKSPYAWQKSAIEDFSKIAYDLYGLDVVCLRYFNVFGPGQYGDSPYSTAVSAWCHAIKEEKECRSDGNGEQTRDMCYIDNVVSANILAAMHKKPFKGEVYNIACGRKVSNNEILEHLTERFGKKVKIKNAPERPGDVKHTLASVVKAKRDFGYEPLVHFWEGLEKTIKWWDL